MFKLIVAVLVLVAVVSAFPSDLEQSVQTAPVSVRSEGVPQLGQIGAAAAAIADDANKESLDKSETFGFGYYGYYPRYYYGGFYPRYYGGYGYYGYGYPHYYW